MDLILAFPIYLLAIILMIMFTPTAGLIGTMKVTAARKRNMSRPAARSACAIRGSSSATSQLSDADHRHHDARYRDRDHRRGHAQLPRARHAAADAELGVGPQANIAFIQANSWLSLFPSLAIFVTVLGFNLFGDGLRDALDPRLK
jgi:hypothetical protein